MSNVTFLCPYCGNTDVSKIKRSITTEKGETYFVCEIEGCVQMPFIGDVKEYERYQLFLPAAKQEPHQRDEDDEGEEWKKGGDDA